MTKVWGAFFRSLFSLSGLPLGKEKSKAAG